MMLGLFDRRKRKRKKKGEKEILKGYYLS